MTRQNQQPLPQQRKPARQPPKSSSKDGGRERDPKSAAPGDTIEGEGSPGLTITGGGGHA
jgi:hypothetical protein